MCACGNSVEFLEAADKPLGDCDIACLANEAETCGGDSSYSLYEILESYTDDSLTITDRECCTIERISGWRWPLPLLQ